MRLDLVADELFPHSGALILLSLAVGIVGVVIYEARDQRVGDFLKDIGGWCLGAVICLAFWFVVVQFGFWLYARFDSGVVGWLGAIGLAVVIMAVMFWVGDRFRARTKETDGPGTFDLTE